MKCNNKEIDQASEKVDKAKAAYMAAVEAYKKDAKEKDQAIQEKIAALIQERDEAKDEIRSQSGLLAKLTVEGADTSKLEAELQEFEETAQSAERRLKSLDGYKMPGDEEKFRNVVETYRKLIKTMSEYESTIHAELDKLTSQITKLQIMEGSYIDELSLVNRMHNDENPNGGPFEALLVEVYENQRGPLTEDDDPRITSGNYNNYKAKAIIEKTEGR